MTRLFAEAFDGPVELLAGGMASPEIVKEYPSLSQEAVRGALEELAHSQPLAVP
jgi:uncharacterized protein (DUF433 family)